MIIQSILYTARLPVVLIICLGLVGCVSMRPKESAAYRDVVPTEGVKLGGANLSPSETGANKDAGGTLDILALSGGGAYGAYGVGFLNGWTKTGTRPKFDIVTGVSTGALTSVFAFLGPQYDPLLRDLYTNVDSSDIYKDKGIAGYASDSLYDNTPLKKQIARVITPQILAAVAAEHAKGRRLYVATTNLDSSELVVWNMGDVANGGRTNPLLHFQKILRASAAVPGFFKPVYIKPKRGVQLRQAHVDGGVKAPVLISDFMFHRKQKKKNLYVIVNDSLAAKDAAHAIEPNLGDIARKSISALTRELLIQTVYRGYARARNSGTNFFLTYVPDKLSASATSLDFDPKFMRSLYLAGNAKMNAGKPWLRQPPNIRTFDVVSR